MQIDLTHFWIHFCLLRLHTTEKFAQNWAYNNYFNKSKL